MVSGGHPEQLTPRHKIIALMVAAGWKQKDIAVELGFHENRVSIIASSPLFRVQVHEIQKQMREGLIDDVSELIKAEALPSVRKIVELRDGEQVPETVQLAAATSILDRAVPKITRHEEDHSLTIYLSKDDVGVMDEVAEELGEVIDVPVDDGPVAPIQPRSLDPIDQPGTGDSEVNVHYQWLENGDEP